MKHAVTQMDTIDHDRTHGYAQPQSSPHPPSVARSHSDARPQCNPGPHRNFRPQSNPRPHGDARPAGEKRWLAAFAVLCTACTAGLLLKTQSATGVQPDPQTQPPAVTTAREPSAPQSQPPAAPATPSAETPPAATRPAPALDLSAYRPAAERILAAAATNETAYRRLAHLCDRIGPRLSGSPGLEAAVDWAVALFEEDGQENIRRHEVMAPKWVRGEESLEMLAPHAMPMPMLGLGGSVATPPEGITATVVPVKDLDELTALGDAVAGKIVLYDHAMSRDDERSGSGYGQAARFRVYGARWAAEHGAVAALVRSATTRSLQTPHTGGMSYFDAPRRIPAAAVTIEHAAMISRLHAAGVEVRVRLKMSARAEGMAPTANVIAELAGRERPEEIVLIGAHIDSWDVGQGAHDDGGGCVMVIESLRLLRELGLRPRRTIRAVLFTNEENGLRGARAYAADHADELPRHVAAIEADSGTFRPLGYGIDAADEETRARAMEQLGGLAGLLQTIGPLEFTKGHGGADIGVLRSAGVPLLGQRVDMTHYFDYHHTHADTLDKVSESDLRSNIALMAATAWLLAEMPDALGK